MLKILEIYQENKFDVLIVDCAPTGETISLLKFPEMFGNMVGKILPVKRMAVKAVGPLVEKAMKIPMPKESVFDDIEILSDRIGRLQELMADKEVFSVRIVTTPEKIVVKEAKRNFTCLHLYDYNVDAVVINKIYPKQSLHGYFQKWMEKQEESIADIKQSFGSIPVFEMPLMERELRGTDCLREAAGIVCQGADPAGVLAEQTVFTMEKAGEGYCFHISLPFVKREELELEQKGDELMVAVKNERRSFILPQKLRNLEITGAKYEEGRLNILFK